MAGGMKFIEVWAHVWSAKTVLLSPAVLAGRVAATTPSAIHNVAHRLYSSCPASRAANEHVERHHEDETGKGDMKCALAICRSKGRRGDPLDQA